MTRTTQPARGRRVTGATAGMVAGAVSGTVSGAAAALWRRVCPRPADDAGEIQGWVFVTLMTAGLVFAIWQVAQDQLTTLFEKAVASVTGG